MLSGERARSRRRGLEGVGEGQRLGSVPCPWGKDRRSRPWWERSSPCRRQRRARGSSPKHRSPRARWSYRPRRQAPWHSRVSAHGRDHSSFRRRTRQARAKARTEAEESKAVYGIYLNVSFSMKPFYHKNRKMERKNSPKRRKKKKKSACSIRDPAFFPFRAGRTKGLSQMHFAFETAP